MKHEPSSYIGIGKDGFLPLESADPFFDDLVFHGKSMSSFDLPSSGNGPNPFFGPAVGVSLLVTIGYLFWSI